VDAQTEGKKTDEKQPKEHRIQIDRVHYTVSAEHMTGADLRRLPPTPIGSARDLFEVVPGHPDRKIGDQDRVKIRNGQRFFTAPTHINPGLGEGYAGVPLPESDLAYLEERTFDCEISTETGMTCLVFAGWELPPGFNHTHADLLVRLSAGYPDVPPDMWWFDPPLRTAQGETIPATESIEMHLGRTWQRWSRHLDAGQWHSGIDGLESYLALIDAELCRSVPVLVR